MKRHLIRTYTAENFEKCEDGNRLHPNARITFSAFDRKHVVSIVRRLCGSGWRIKVDPEPVDEAEVDVILDDFGDPIHSIVTVTGGAADCFHGDAVVLDFDNLMSPD